MAREPDRAARVAGALEDFAGMLHAAGILIVACDHWSALKKRPIANKYVFQMAFGGILITMRKFLDLWAAHIEHLLPDGSDAKTNGEALVTDARSRRMWSAASGLVAHYAVKGKGSWPLSPRATMALVTKTKFANEEQILQWSRTAATTIIRIRDEINRLHGVRPK